MFDVQAGHLAWPRGWRGNTVLSAVDMDSLIDRCFYAVQRNYIA